MHEDFERIHHNPITALVSEDVGKGVFCTEVVIFHGEHEVTIDFIQGIVKPYRVVSRVIISSSVAKKFFSDLKGELINSDHTVSDIDPIKDLIEQNQKNKEKVEDIYEELKLVDNELKGVYANKILITYGKDAFCMDFINNTYPKSIVTSRVFMSFNRSLQLLLALKKIIDI